MHLVHDSELSAAAITITTSRLFLYQWGKMNTSRIVAGTALLALMLTSCSSPQPEAAPTVSVAPAATQSATPTPTPTATRNENERGQLVKKIGEPASLMTDEESDKPTMTFKVTSIKPIKCDAPYATPPNGTAIAVALEIITTPTFAGPLEVDGQPGMISFRPYYWKGYASNGTRMNTVDSHIMHGCLADETRLLPDYFGKGEKLNGLVILDVTTPSGEVSFDPNGNGGWVWKYPSA